MFNKEIKSILQLVNSFPTEESCIKHLEAIRWKDGNVVSPFDNTSKVYKCKGNRYQCKNTGKYFNVKTNTIFDNTKIELRKWFMAIWLVTAHKKGISSLQLGRDLDITQKSAWFMLQRIRNCFGINEDNDKAENMVEVDETYVGGANRNKSLSKRKEIHKNGPKTGGSHKNPVLGILQRDGYVRAFAIDKSTGGVIKPILFEKISEYATVITDGYGAYRDIDKHFLEHRIVYHDKKQYVDGEYHTNTLEGFWGLFKRGIIGIYHLVSRKHLQKYVDEFSFRYNTRKQTDYLRFNLLLLNIENRITYKELINA